MIVRPERIKPIYEVAKHPRKIRFFRGCFQRSVNAQPLNKVEDLRGLGIITNKHFYNPIILL